MFRFIFFHTYEIFAVIACVLIVGVLIFATRYRLKQDAAEKAQEQTTPENPKQDQLSQVEMREVGLVSAGMAPTYETDKKQRKAKAKAKSKKK